ncbi:MAG TPA: TRAM domain-containing protein [Vicinamibacteria bacterium]|nr:TRAM domain-containing protein [Vicinamibacteria bacterium]
MRPASPTRNGLHPGQLVEAVIEKGVYRGRGLGRVDGRVVFVPRAHPGDRVRARVTEVHPGWAEGDLVEVLAAAPARRASPCPYVPRCGGCSYQDLAYEAQLRVKESVLRESLGRAGAPWEGPVAVHASPETGWRMRASLHFATGENGLRLGLQQEGTHRVVDVLACLQLSERMNRAARALRDALAGNPALGPRLRGLDLLESPDGGTLLASLETALAPHEAPTLVSLAARVPGLDGFGVATGPRLQWLHGAPFVEASVLGVVLRARARSFFQANRFLLEPLARTVVDLVPPGDGRVVDLYAGVGLFALPLAARGEREVLAVEWASSAAEDARWAARRNRLDAVRVVAGDVATALAEAGPGKGERIVLDPPRTGAGPEVVALVADRAPAAIVYVSCDPPTLGRDLAALAKRGYRPDVVHLFDLFPDTFHMETVVRLRRS